MDDYSINALVESKENKFVSSLVDAMTSDTFEKLFKFLINEDPTNPVLPKIITFKNSPLAIKFNTNLIYY